MGFWNKIFGKGGSYFLDDEAAKGLGDTEYMKQSKAVRRTFPGVAGEEEFEVTQQVSAIDRATFDSRKGGAAPAPRAATSSSSSFGGSSFGSSNFGSSNFGNSSFGNASFSSSSFGGSGAGEPAPAAEAEPAAAPEPEFQPSRSTNVDSSMDMFRNMAKKIGR
ncbi:MAG: hypothetical protein RLZZ511_1354 [Cyanobacteriota bacterium]|jgi:hypothetical protein